MQFITDPNDKSRYRNVRVCRRSLRDCLLRAPKTSRPEIYLLNAMIGLVFSLPELARSSGLGLRGNKKTHALDTLKVSAIKGLLVCLHVCVLTTCNITPMHIGSVLHIKVDRKSRYQSMSYLGEGGG